MDVLIVEVGHTDAGCVRSVFCWNTAPGVPINGRTCGCKMSWMYCGAVRLPWTRTS